MTRINRIENNYQKLKQKMRKNEKKTKMSHKNIN